jgi:GST-like protein
MAAYALYGRLDTGSAAAEAALAEAGASYEVVAVPKDAQTARDSGYHAINPRGQVPALVLPDGTIVTECAAILLHIADAFPQAALAPAPGTSARARHDRWLLFFHANLYEGELRRFYPDRYTDDPAGVPGVKAAALDYVRRHYALFDAQMGETPYALGSQMTVLDIYLWMLVQWFDRDWLAAHCPRLLAVTDRVAARPAIAPIHAAHFGQG